MRIIAGTAGGIRLQTVAEPALRPMLDRVKESLFNIIQADVPGRRALDLFSGSGSLGLEALSRGAESCVFVERDRGLAQLVRRNARKCDLEERCRVIEADVFRLPSRTAAGEDLPAGLVFLDPPYAVIDDPNRRGEFFGVVEQLCGCWIAPRALVVLHHPPLPAALWPTERLRETDTRTYGSSQLTFFTVAEQADE